jgi:quinol monooxygenase YgiN
MKFAIMDYTGHTTMEFKAEQKAEAEELFAKLLADGRTAATRETGKTDYTVIRDPAQISDETLFVQRLVGG